MIQVAIYKTKNEEAKDPVLLFNNLSDHSRRGKLYYMQSRLIVALKIVSILKADFMVLVVINTSAKKSKDVGKMGKFLCSIYLFL